jgi:hypothetical protein
VADQLSALVLVLAVTVTVCPTVACVVDAVKLIVLSVELDLLQATNTSIAAAALKMAFFIFDFLSG